MGINDNLTVCPSCSCMCWLVSKNCVVSFSELTDSSVIRTNDINNTNDDVGDLIGEECLEALCAASTKAVQDANVWNQNPGNASEQKTLLDFLPTMWLTLIGNRHFKRWYSNRVSYHWLEGSSITELRAVGLITTTNEDESFKNGFKHAEEKQRRRLSSVAQNYASGAKAKFLTHFWTPKTAQAYGCSPDCGCSEETSNDSGTSIGMEVL